MKKILFQILLIFCAFSQKKIFSQVECRSTLGSHFKPISKKIPIYWSAELTASLGLMTDRKIRNGMAILGLEYARPSNKHKFYFEGSGKNWKNSKKGPSDEGLREGKPDFNRPEKNNFGIREAFYQFKKNKNTLKIGVQSIKIGDYFLVDERVLGANYNMDFGAIKLNSSLVNVNKDFARMQNVCGVRHIFNVAHRSEFNLVGSEIGETNFFATTLLWRPSDKIEEENNDEEFDEFDEFSETDDEFGDVNEKTNFLKEAGLIFYEEFGSEFHDYKYYFGAISNINLPMGFNLKMEVLHQQITNDKTIIYYSNLIKDIFWKSGNSTNFQIAYMGKLDIDENTYFQAAFSNLYKGEVFRLDLKDVPLLFASVKHNFNTKIKLYLKLKLVEQIEKDKTREIDFEIGMKLFKHLQIVNMISYMKSKSLKEDYFLERIELRFAF